MAKTQVKNYEFKPGIGLKDNLFPDAYDLIERNREFIKQETIAWLDSQIDQEEAGFEGYTYNENSLLRDIEENLDAFLYDFRYGGNSKIYVKASYYWEEDVAQIAGSRIPEAETYRFIKNLILEYILDNEAFEAENIDAEQVIDTTKNPLNAADARVEELFDIGIAVIESGLSELPEKTPTGVGTVSIQGQYDIEDILLITNVTKNEIIFNFANPNTGGEVSLRRSGSDEDFPSYLQKTDAVTTLSLNYNTSAHPATDELQIFIEFTENGKSVVTTRPFDFGTDAIERMRVATPYSMLDADFEYGLQPTKWAAIGVLRGYPSVYEIPGTDTEVASVVTDASAGTDGVGQSKITVTTIGPHGFEAGTPITIKALEDSVTGAARAEGSFVIVEIVDDRTFTYFAKSKVGTEDGQVLATTFTQLREAGFYTGADIGNPVIDVISQGSAGTIVAELDVNSGETIIPYDGPTPEVGAPLSGTGIASGTQITGTIETSAGGGVYITPSVVGDYAGGTRTISLADTSGVVQDLAADNTIGTAIYITNISGNEIEFSQGFDNPVIGNETLYESVSGTNIDSTGTGAVFDVSKANGEYTVTVNQTGTGFVVGDRVIITGDKLGGLSPDHDLVVITEAIDVDGGITDFSTEGEAFDGTGTVFVDETTVDGGEGTGAAFDIVYENNSYTQVDITSPDLSQDYTVGDIILIPGDQFTPNGSTPENDLTIEVTGIGTGGSITSVNFDGTAPDAQEAYDNPSFTYTGSGTALDFVVERNGDSYNIIISENGTNFQPAEVIEIAGTELGGATPDNDLTITVDEVDAQGGITAFSLSGTAVNTDSLVDVSGDNIVGAGATFDVEFFESTYDNIVIVDGGQDYTTNQTIIIPGTDLLGDSPENDLVVDIASVDQTGGIVSANISSGTAIADAQSFSNVTSEVQQPEGVNARFDILRKDSEYTATVSNQGEDYAVGNRIRILGSELGGTNGDNDLVLRVLEVEPGGLVLDDSSAGVEEIYDSAVEGINLDLISTVTLSESLENSISQGDTFDFELLATLEITFDSAHGLVPGSTFIVDIESDDGTNLHTLAAGSYFATDIPEINKLRYTARAAGTIDTDDGNDPIAGIIYPRPDSFFIHRPYDGGVQLGTGGPQHGTQAIRQSKKYIRYQSGKGIMYTTGALFAPSYDLRSVVADDVEVDSTITITTDDNDHGVQEGGIIRLLNIETPGYSSGPETAIPPEFDYEVINVIDERTFQVRSQRRLGSTEATLAFGAQMSVISWHGATVRSGIFDDQNGIFWEYDGTQISVVQRTGTFQIAGTMQLTVDSNEIVGTNTRFRDQLKAGDRIIIKGMTHVVSHVIDQTNMTVTPDWRGVTDVASAKGMLIRDKKVKQSEFNLDKLDGTGPSGYDIDIAKMQMIGIQYSWYGAGFIDFMVRGADGNFVYAHRMRNSNVNTEAFMRSGNLPVRYEVVNEGPPGKLKESITDTDSELILEDSSFFPNQGVVYIDNEIIRFTGNNEAEHKLTGLTRGAEFSNYQAGATRFYAASDAVSHDARTGVILISSTITPLISHWGSAFITDGQFDDDRGYIFSYAETGVEASTTQRTAFMIRLAPSVSNALIGNLGERELLNRAQLLLQGMEITSDSETDTGESIQGGIVIEGILNPKNYPENPESVRWSGLSGVSQGGQPSFAEIASGGSIEWTTGDEATTATINTLSTITKTLTQSQFNDDRNVRIQISEIQSEFGTTDPAVLIGEQIYSSKIRPGTRLQSFRVFGSYARYRLSQRATSRINVGETIELRRGEDLTNRNFALFGKTDFESAPIVAGTPISGGSVQFPAGTQVSNVSPETFAGIEYYEVSFNSSFDGTLSAGTGTVEFEFRQPPFAQPGETVFSFIAVPGERAELSLDSLKELTNTPLGGRGTFPNGPDVLAINILKTKGAAVDTNIILKWGEAQA